MPSAMRLKFECRPYPLYGHMRYTRGLRHTLGGPVGRVLRRLLNCSREQAYNLLIADFIGLSGLCRIMQPGNTLLQKTAAPLTRRVSCHIKAIRNSLIGLTFGTGQHN